MKFLSPPPQRHKGQDVYRDVCDCELRGPMYAEALGTKLDKLNLEKGLARSTELCALLNVIEMKIKQPPFESFGLCKGSPSQHRCAVSFPVSNLAGIVLP